MVVSDSATGIKRFKRNARQVNSESRPSKLCAENLAPESEANEKEDKTAEKDAATRKQEDTPKEQAKAEDKKEAKEAVRDELPHRKRKMREEALQLKVVPWAYPLNQLSSWLERTPKKKGKKASRDWPHVNGA